MLCAGNAVVLAEWNAARGIELFRITSDLIPFGSSVTHGTVTQRSLFELITGGHGDTQDINAFSFLDVADETVLVL
jgi:hypothetical protein